MAKTHQSTTGTCRITRLDGQGGGGIGIRREQYSKDGNVPSGVGIGTRLLHHHFLLILVFLQVTP